MTSLFIFLQDQLANHVPKPTLLGGLIVAIVIAYLIAKEVRGKNFKRGRNNKKHGIDNFWWLIIAAIIFYLLLENGRIG
ncbi:MAG: hypothetical protein ABI091_06650 [Ferruginibacter sp.]